MQHSYDLLIQSRAVGEAVPLDELVKVLTERGATLSVEGRGAWKLKDGEVAIAPVREEGTVRGLDVQCPFEDGSALLEGLVQALLEVAEATQTRVMDPQRSEQLSLAGAAATVDEYLRMGRYAGEYGGVSSALGLSSWAAASPQQEESSSFRWLMVLAVFVVALYSGWRAIVVIRESRAAEAAEVGPRQPPRPVDGATKVPGK
jgi:hypothetical protein